MRIATSRHSLRQLGGIEYWTHIAVVRTSTTLQVYINGVLQTGTYGGSAVSTVTSVNTNAGLRLGRYNNGGLYFNGRIDETAVYSRALTAAEVAALIETAELPSWATALKGTS